MPRHDTATIREALSREGLRGAELETAVLAYTIANNFQLDHTAEAEEMIELKRIIEYLRHTPRKD
jgi:hypothetical protein